MFVANKYVTNMFDAGCGGVRPPGVRRPARSPRAVDHRSAALHRTW
ncbi:hypothetical protein RM764_23715 [Streptomyces sp. DSM 41699]|uniref:Uncharacterized protein n=1 Tax=Streptomyces gibsoniae TaxID=3075529 RepID=A0ABU2TYD7_9ACTN|nr:hypothetical protein [Streptomyces sp. DSM 41699]